MIHVEVFHAPCCGGPDGQRNEARLANLMPAIQHNLQEKAKISVHTLAMGDRASTEAISRLADYLRASGLPQFADAGVFGMLGALPIFTLNGVVRFLKTVPSQTELLEAIGQSLDAASGSSV